MRPDSAVEKQTLDLIGHGRGCTRADNSDYTAGNGTVIPMVGESYDYAKAAISLEHSNSFPWSKDCVQIHHTLFPPRGWDLGMRLSHRQNFGCSLLYSL